MRSDLNFLYKALAVMGVSILVAIVDISSGDPNPPVYLALLAAVVFSAYLYFQHVVPTWKAIEEEEKLYQWNTEADFRTDLLKGVRDTSPLVDNLVSYYRWQFSKREPAHEIPELYSQILDVCEASINAFTRAQSAERKRFKTKSPFSASLRSLIGEKKTQEVMASLAPPFEKAPDFIKETLKRYRNDEEFEREEDEELYTLLEHTPHHPIARKIIATFDDVLPLPLTQEVRFEHMHILAGSGWGKTQTLQRLILHDLATDAALIVIDSQQDMLSRIAHLKTDREIIYIDPTDTDFPAAINPFDVSRLEGLPQADRERFLNNLIQLLEFVFAGLLKAELTQKQNVLFRYSLRVMLACEGTNLLDLVRFMEDPHPYLARAKNLPIVVQQFFQTAFTGKQYVQTMSQITQRLYGVLENDTFLRMLTSKKNRINLKEAMERGAIVLVDTNKNHLAAEASSLLGRYFIALTLQAALERGSNANRGAFLYVDEAGEYVDENVEALLTEARKRKVGVILAHQKLQDLRSPELRSAVSANTSVKLAGGGDNSDARWMADNMRTTADFIHSMRKTADHTEFACFIRNVMPAVKIEVPFGTMENAPQLSVNEYEEWRELNRRTLSEGIIDHLELELPDDDDDDEEIVPIRE